MYCLSLSRDVRNGVPRGFFRVDFSRPSSEKAFEGASRKHGLRGAPARGPLPGSGLRPGHVQWRRQRASGVTSSTCRFRRWEGEGQGRGVTTGVTIGVGTRAHASRGVGRAASTPAAVPGSSSRQHPLLCHVLDSSQSDPRTWSGGSEGFRFYPCAQSLHDYSAPTMLRAVSRELRT